MSIDLFAQLTKELKTQPITLVAVTGVCVALWYASTTHARDNDVQALASLHSSTEAKVNLLVELNLADHLRRSRRAWCSESSPRARELLEQSIDRYVIEYRRVTNIAFEFDPCNGSSGAD